MSDLLSHEPDHRGERMCAYFTTAVNLELPNDYPTLDNEGKP